MYKKSTFCIRLFSAVMMALLLATLIHTQPALAARTCTERFYLSPIIGDGTEAGPIRPLIADLTAPNGERPWLTWSAIYGPTDPITAEPISWWAFVSVSAFNHNFLLHNDELGALPDLAPTTMVSDLNKKEISVLREILVQFEIDTSILETATYYQDVLNFIGYTLAGEAFVMPVTYCY